jgi:hypothetical protein
MSLLVYKFGIVLFSTINHQPSTINHQPSTSIYLSIPVELDT